MATLGRFLKLKQQQQQVEEPAPSPAPALKNPRAIGRNLMIGGGLASAGSVPLLVHGGRNLKAIPLLAGLGAGTLGGTALALGTGYALANRAARRRKQKGGYEY
jgi:hypothetical protein